MDKLKKLIESCECGVHLSVNEHRDYDNTVEDHLEGLSGFGSSPPIAEDVRTKMMETNTIIDLQFYPDRSIRFCAVFHYDLEKALDEALECLEEEKSILGTGLSAETVALVSQRKTLNDLSHRCPECNSDQLQLVGRPPEDVIWKCRRCKTKIGILVVSVEDKVL